MDIWRGTRTQSHMPGRQHTAQLCRIPACTCCYGTACEQNTKPRAGKKNHRVWTCQATKSQVEAPGLSIRAWEGQALQQSISDTRGSELPEFPEPGRDPGRASPSLPRHQQQPSLFSLFKSHSTNTFFTCSYHNKVPKSVEKQSKSSSAREKRREQNRGKEGYIKYSQGSGK